MELTRRMARLEHDLQHAERLLLAVDNSRFFRAARWPGRICRDWYGRLGQLLLHSPLHPLYLRLAGAPACDPSYLAWIERQCDAPTPIDDGPLFSVIMPVHNPARPWLEAAVESVRRQSYPRWELCVCDDASREQWVRDYFATPDARTRFIRSERNIGIAEATNMAGTLARGEYLAFLDQDDLLDPDALAWVAHALQPGPADLLYTDEDRLNEEGVRVEPMFKPGWSPELLLSCMYMGHLLVARREAVERAGWLRGAFDGAQDYDLALRITDAGGVVRHVSRILYHWRRHAGSTAAHSHAKPYTQTAGRAALAEAAARRCISAVVEDGPTPNSYRLRRQLSGRLASIVICSRRARLLKRCLRGIERRTAYPHREIVVVEHQCGEPPLQFRGVRVPYTGPFDFASMNNLGAQHASGEVLVFLNDDVIPLDPVWLAALVAQAEQPETGVAGARLVYPNGAIQHAGMAIGVGTGAAHPQRDTFGAGYWPWWALSRDVAAVTGACMAIRRQVFEELGGFDTRFPVNYNDADLCLRARRSGYRVIYEASALMRHDECRTRRPGIRFAERALWSRIWGGWQDPYYSMNLDQSGESAGLNDAQAAGAIRKRCVTEQ